MKAEELELLRLGILRVLDSNRTRRGTTRSVIGHLLKAYYPGTPTSDELADQLDYLLQKELVEEPPKVVSAEVRVWRITEKGIAFVDQNL